ncbi:unnamed protein product [Brassica oleracea]
MGWSMHCSKELSVLLHVCLLHDSSLCIRVGLLLCIKESEDITIWKAMLKTPASIALIIYTFICMWFVGGLTGFHLYLISTNQTTYENFRYSYDRRSNPHNKGVVDNFKEIFCSAIPPSKNDFRAMVTREAPMPSRSAVGGFVSPNMGRGNDEIEMRRKGVWAMAEHGADKNGGNDERFHVNDDELGDIRTTTDDDERSGRPNIHPRHSSWEMSPEVVALAARRT